MKKMWEIIHSSPSSRVALTGNDRCVLEELDRRADAAIKNAHPRKDRVVGTPMKVDPPRTTKD